MAAFRIAPTGQVSFHVMGRHKKLPGEGVIEGDC